VFAFIGLMAGIASSIAGYVQSRRFVRHRLKYVQAVQKPTAGLIAGGVAAAVALPVVALLPLVGIGTALLFGAGVGAGVSAGARDLRRRLAAH
jgi:hypothetical protein